MPEMPSSSLPKSWKDLSPVSHESAHCTQSPGFHPQIAFACVSLCTQGSSACRCFSDDEAEADASYDMVA